MIEPTGQPTRIQKAITTSTTIYNRCRPVLRHVPRIVKWVLLIVRIHESLS